VALTCVNWVVFAVAAFMRTTSVEANAADERCVFVFEDVTQVLKWTLQLVK
jgi:hypothetical protein